MDYSNRGKLFSSEKNNLHFRYPVHHVTSCIAAAKAKLFFRDNNNLHFRSQAVGHYNGTLLTVTHSRDNIKSQGAGFAVQQLPVFHLVETNFSQVTLFSTSDSLQHIPKPQNSENAKRGFTKCYHAHSVDRSTKPQALTGHVDQYMY